MNTIDSIVEDLRSLPKDRFAAVAETIHKMREDYRAERNRVLDETAGCMSEQEAAAFEEALKESRRIDAN